jgi:hypothetical protein
MEKIYLIKLDERVSSFYGELAAILQRPIEEMLSDSLYATAEFISKEVQKRYDNEP